VALDEQDGLPGASEVAGSDEAVVATSDDDYVDGLIRVRGHPTRICICTSSASKNRIVR
jgi:predicted nuclease of predicted toxin-antitoxin system